MPSLNRAEKVTGTYLRLNGFLHLPLFTVFSNGEHGHVDYVALRAKNSVEEAGNVRFLIDEEFFDLCATPDIPDPRAVFLGAVAEVRTNNNREAPSDYHTAYAQQFLGGVPMVRLSFCDCKTPLWRDDDGVVVVSLNHAMTWVRRRILWMQKQGWKFTKFGSWTLSEDFLGDVLVELEREWGVQTARE